MSQRYTITVTEEQLAGLRHAQSAARVGYEESLPRRVQGVAVWEKYPDDTPEKARYLAMARESLEYVRRNLALVKDASAPLYSAKPIPARKTGAWRSIVSYACFEDYCAEVPIILPEPVLCMECETNEPEQGCDHCASCLNELDGLLQ